MKPTKSVRKNPKPRSKKNRIDTGSAWNNGTDYWVKTGKVPPSEDIPGRAARIQ